MSNTPLPSHLSDSTKSHQESIFESQIVSILQLGMFEGTVVGQAVGVLHRMWDRKSGETGGKVWCYYKSFFSHQSDWRTRVWVQGPAQAAHVTHGLHARVWSAAAGGSSTLSDRGWPSLFHHHFRSLGLSQHEYHRLLSSPRLVSLGRTSFGPCCFYIHLQLLCLRPLISDPRVDAFSRESVSSRKLL